MFANLQIHRQNTTHNSMCIKSKNTKNTQAQHKQHNINVCFKFTNTRTKQIYSLVSNTMERYFYKRGDRLFCCSIVLGKYALRGVPARQHYSNWMQMTALKKFAKYCIPLQKSYFFYKVYKRP